MKLRSATAIALALGLGLGVSAVSSTVMAADAKPETPAVGKLPGNTGNEGAGGGLARDKGLIDARDHSDKAAGEMTKDDPRLPGNVGNEGNAGGVGSPSESGYTTSSGGSGGVQEKPTLPGNLNNEGSGKAK